MTATPFTVKETDTVRFAAQLMLKHDMGFLPVLADTTTPRLAGVVTDRDITVRCVAGGMPLDSFVAAVMTKPPLATVTPDASMDEVAQMMERARVRRLPVLGARD
ncbi:MAG: CBS domain-containing protein, partial [Gemmatimonadota bacterium]|nr:CBS domain-containing protein [Gemmatimonadota bacterium]